MNHRKLLAVAVMLIGIVVFVFLVPLPRKVACTLETRHADAVVICAPYTGSLERVCVEPGQSVVAGQLLAELRSVDLELDIARLQAEVKSQQFALRALQYERFKNPQAIEAVGQASEVLAASQSQLAERSAELKQLRLVAPKSGTVLPPARRAATVAQANLAAWSGTPLDERNAAAPLAQGDVVCEIGDPQRMEAVLVVDQAEVEYLRRGQQVELVLDAEPLRMQRGVIAEISLGQLEGTPGGLSVQAGGQVPSHIDRAGVQRPTSPSFSVVVPLAGAGIAPAAGMRGSARIHTGGETLANRAWRYVCRTFRFEW